ncbi:MULTISPECIES: hypothetical protein [Peribacillus]|uniref:hypothetical protein n=1 Tax=Peribacillus TaxID=2675229 RepID=UPI001F4D4610|nr:MULTISPECIES: hypothetical protein [unclassified Peribacillus]MCK1985803.1 hypothetical protein [Peribacillus sp. Aquil_B1]MCK2010729.1 hypothetical protein [Peribacillus sp. Aquil_B8]
MDKEMEKIIVKSFFTKRLQDRVLFELSSNKKRKDALSRLCHTYRTTLREEYIMEISKPNSDPVGIAKLLKQNGAGHSCYVISWDEDIDGMEIPLLTALEKVVGMGMPAIISCIPNKLAYFEAEQEVLPSPRFLLKRNHI